MKRLLKDWLLLIGIGWSSVLLVQLLEFPFHLEFMRYHTLILPLLLFATAVYFIIGIPSLSLIYLPLGGAGIWKPRFRVPALVVTLVLWVLLLFRFQQWAIANAFLSVSLTYYQALGIVLLLLLCACLSRWGRAFLFIVAPLTLLLLIGWRYTHFWVPRWVEQGQGPNVLLIVADTLRKDHTSLYGYDRDTTPFLNSLADNAVVFDDVVSSSSWTKPAMASLLTSRYLQRDRILVGPLPIGWDGMRLPEFFYKVGYETALLTANPNTGSYFEATRGYQWITQAKPPRHFALETFVLPKLFNTYVRMKEWLKFNNARRRLESYRETLGFKTLSELSRFDRRQLNSRTISTDQEEAYRRQVKTNLKNYALFNIRVKKRYPAWRMKWIVPYLDPLYRKILKFSFITLEGARGTIVDHWIRDRELSRSFIHWYEHDRDPDRPFFAHLQYMGPHTPYQEQSPYLIPHFDPDSPFNVENPPSQHKLPSQGAKELIPEKLHNMVANYDDAVRMTDANIKEVVEFLRKKGQLDNTLIVFASDHGEAFYEHRIYGHMYSLYSELVNVPLFFYWPRHLTPNRSDIPTALVDIFPSLAVLTGHDQWLQRVKNLEGVSLFKDDGEIIDEDLSERIRYGITRVHTRRKKRPGSHTKPRRAEVIHRMVIQGDNKLLEEIEPSGRRLFLFSLKDSREPLETVDRHDPKVVPLYRLFRPLPDDYVDINEPEVEHEVKE